MQITKERVSEFGDKSIEIIQPKEQRGKKRLKKKNPTSSETCVTIIKRSDIHINGVPEEEIKEIDDGCRKNI